VPIKEVPIKEVPIRERSRQPPLSSARVIKSEGTPEMVQVTFEIPEHLLGQFYLAVGRALQNGQDEGAAEQAEPAMSEWSVLDVDDAAVVWRKFSPRAQAVFSVLMDSPGIALPADELAAKIGLTNGRHGLAGVVAWPSRQCAELGFVPPFRFDNSAAPNEAGTYWMDPETADLFRAVRQRSMTKSASGQVRD
jgi:hypothetical protein